jgi:hypothetical protein
LPWLLKRMGSGLSFCLDPLPLLAAARSAKCDPVRSDAAAYLAARDDSLVTVRPLLELVPGWEVVLGEVDSGCLTRGGSET